MGHRLCCRCRVPNIDLGHFPPRVARPLTAGAWLPSAAIVDEVAATCEICPLLRTFGPKRQVQGRLDSEADVDEAAKAKQENKPPHFQGGTFSAVISSYILSRSAWGVGVLFF